MLRILRAFAWMRWRLLVNSLERTGARDTLERFSVAIEQVAPIITLALFFPTAMVLAALGFYAGYGMTSIESGGFAFTVFRYLLLTATALSILGPIMLPSAEQTDAVRLLLLPIPPRTLYVAQAAATVSDPWILLVTPMVATFPAGLALGGAPVTALVALLCGVLVLATFMGLSFLTTMIVYLIVRDRRRGELVAFVFILVLPFVGLLPSMLDAQHRRAERRGEAAAQERLVPEWLRTASAGLYALTFPPVRARALAWVALVPLLAALRDASLRRRLGLGLLWTLAVGWGVGTWMPGAVSDATRRSTLHAVVTWSGSMAVRRTSPR